MCTCSNLVALVLLVSPGVVAARQGPTVGFDLSRDGAVVVPVMLGGAGPFRFRLDTGSMGTVISQEVVQRLGLPQVGSAIVLTPTGPVKRPVTRIAHLEFGGEHTTGVTAVIQPGSRLSGALRGEIDGLLGQDVLAARAFTIDYANRRLAFEGAAVREGTRLPLLITDSSVLVALPQPGPDRTRRFIPDSGADGVVLFARRGTRPWSVTPLDTGLIRTTSGQKLARRVRIDELHIGDHSLRNHVAVLVDGENVDARLGDGLLPLHLFARVTFNGPERYLIVEGRSH